MVEHEGVVNLAIAQSAAFRVRAQSRVLQFASFSFDACVSEIAMALTQRALLYLRCEDVLSAMNRHEITHVTLPPALLAGLETEVDFDALEVLIVAGEAPSQELVKRWGHGRTLFNAYGPTETTVCASIYKCDPEVALRPHRSVRSQNTRIYLLDGFGNPRTAGGGRERSI